MKAAFANYLVPYVGFTLHSGMSRVLPRLSLLTGECAIPRLIQCCTESLPAAYGKEVEPGARPRLQL